MKKKQYISPLSVVCACNVEGAMMIGSNTGTLQVGGTSDDEWFSKRNDDFDEPDDGDNTANGAAYSSAW